MRIPDDWDAHLFLLVPILGIGAIEAGSLLLFAEVLSCVGELFYGIRELFAPSSLIQAATLLCMRCVKSVQPLSAVCRRQVTPLSFGILRLSLSFVLE